MDQWKSLTCCELQPSTDLIDGCCVAESEQTQAAHADPHHDERHADQHSGRLEGREWGQGVKRPTAFWDGPIRLHADLKEAQRPGRRNRTPSVVQLSCAHPRRLDENDHLDHGKAERADGPQHAHCPRAPDELGLIQTGHLRRVTLHAGDSRQKDHIIMMTCCRSPTTIFKTTFRMFVICPQRPILKKYQNTKNTPSPSF